MKTNRDYIKENKFEKIKHILDDSSLDKLFKNDESFTEDDFKDLEGVEDYIGFTDEVFPGSISIKFDAIYMTAFLTLKDAVNTKCDITMLEITDAIKAEGDFFSSRVNWDTVRDLFEKVIIEHGESAPVIVAEGIKIKPHIPEHIIIKDSLNPDFKPKAGIHNRVNYHHINAFVYVEKGEFLGDVIPDQPGVDGKSLKENKIHFPTIVVNTYKCGKNTFVSGGKVYSSIDGTYKILDGFIEIESCLSVNTDIDYHTGDIEYKGDVTIKGSVREGFSVKSEGDLLVEKSIEPCEIECGNNLYVKEGIVGSGKFCTSAKGSVCATHIENAEVKSGSHINVRNSIIKSDIYSMDRLIMPKGSSIIGGNLYFQNGIVTGNIGNKTGVETRIILGIDFEAEEKLSKVKVTIDEIIINMAELQETLPLAKDREERDKIKYLFLSLKNRINSLHNYARALLSKIDKNERAFLETYGTIYPGTYVEICHTRLKITDELHNVRLSLNKEIGEIIVEYLHR